MKKIALLLVLFFSTTFFAQVTKLSSLSSSKFLDSKIIYEDNNEDIYGYLLLFEKDKVNKNETTFELVLLDKNLNKVGTTSFNQEVTSSWLIKLSSAIYFAKKNKDNLFVAIGQSNSMIESFIDKMIEDKGISGFRILNLKDFTISENYLIKDYKFQKQIGKLDMEHPMKLMKEFKDMKLAKLTLNNGFLVSDLDYMSSMNEAMASSYPNALKMKVNRQKEFYFFDLNFQQKWVYKVNQDEKTKSFAKYSYFTSNGNDLVFTKKNFKKEKDTDFEQTFEFVNATTGVKKFEINITNTENTLSFDNLQFQDNKVIVFASVYDFNEKGEYKYDKKRGYVKIVYDRESGKEISKDYFKWDALKSKLDIDENGKVKDYGFIHFLEFKLTADNKIIIIGEGYKPEASSKILDLFTFVLDDKMKLLSFNKVDKFKNKIDKLDAYGSYLEAVGAFDYMYSQKLPGGGYVFYYSDNEKLGSRAKKDPKWVLGVITYVDGVFDYQKVPLTTNNGQIYPIKAKNGYVLLREVSNDEKQKDSEIRLEKINY